MQINKTKGVDIKIIKAIDNFTNDMVILVNLKIKKIENKNLSTLR